MHTLLRAMGRPKQFSDRIHLTLPEGMKERATAVLEPGEDRMALIRKALEAELRRRERKRPDGGK